MLEMNDLNGDIASHRTKIDEIDAELVRLLNERATAALAIGKLKASTGAKVYDPAREGHIIETIDSLNAGPLSKGAMEDIFHSVIDACRQIQITD
jgi:chorismate mutase